MAAESDLNWSILGLGRFGRIHAQTLQSMSGIRLHSACSRNAETLEQHAKELQLANTTTSAAEILADEMVDIVSVVTHWQDHHQLTLDALRAGKHVFLEKPISATKEQAQEILQTSKASSGFLMVGHICRFDPRYSLARDAILAGEIGEVTTIHAKRNLPVAPTNIRLGKIPPLIGDGIHDLDLAMWILGRKPNSVFAKNIRIHDFPYPDAGWAMFDFSQSGNTTETLVVIETHWGLPSSTETVIDARMEIIGTEGKITIDCSQTGLHIKSDQSRHVDTCYWPKVGSEFEPNFPALPGYGILMRELEYFANCVRQGRNPKVISVQQACDALEMILIAQESADSQQPIQIS